MTDSADSIPEIDLREKFILAFKENGGSARCGDGTDMIISLNGSELTVDFGPLQKEYNKTGGLSGYNRLFSAVLSEAGIIPSWESVKECIFPVFYSTALNPGDVISDDMTDEFNCAYFYDLLDRKEWISQKHLDFWKTDMASLRETAVENLKKQVDQSEFSIDTDEENNIRIGYFDTDFFYPTSFLIAPNLSQKLILGGFMLPVYAYMPTSEIFEIFQDCDIDEAILAYGNTVLSEFLSDPHPVTPEIIEIAEDGIHVVGRLERNGDDAEFLNM